MGNNILNNTFSENIQETISIKETSGLNIETNNLVNNSGGNYIVINNTPNNIAIPGNYWGTDLESKISKLIYDRNDNPDVGDVLKVDVFNPGDLVDITGISKGRGFTGVIKRYGFNQPPMTHGTHESYRGGGSIGAASYPARVWPGLKMAGRMGGENVTVKNLTVIKIDLEKGLLVVKGAVPGAAGGLVVIRKND